MKSIMEEASSIFKAVENAWKRAGQPDDFSIKIYEEPQRNFFGMTTKSAKIGLFFTEKTPAKTTSTKTSQQQATKPKVEIQKNIQAQKPTQQKNIKQAPKNIKQQPVKKEVAPNHAKQVTPQEKTSTDTASLWTADMVNQAEKWMRTTLSLMNLSHVNFSTTLSKYYVHFTFETKVFENSEKEKAFFRSCAYLVIAMLRNQFKRELRGFKVVLSS